MNYCPFLENIYRHIDMLVNPEFLTFKDLFCACLGASLGIILGYFLTVHLNKQQRKQETINLQNDLIKVFKSNIRLINQCIDQLENKNEIPNYPLDINPVNYILFKGKNLFSNEDLYTQFNWQRFQLEHINNKLIYYFNISLNSNKSDAYTLLVSNEKKSLLHHLTLTKKEISNLLSRFEESL